MNTSSAALQAWRVVAPLSALAIVVGALWHFAFDAYRQGEIAQLRRELAAITEVKRQRVQGWLVERRSDAAVLGELTFVRDALGIAPDSPRLADPRRQLELYLTNYDYAALYLFDPAARLRLAAGAADSGLVAAVVADNDGFANGDGLRIASLRLRQANGDTRLFLQFVAPIRSDGGHGGTLVLLVDALAATDPLAAVNRGRIRSREVIIVERRGEELRVLNTPLHAVPAELSIEAGNPLRPAAQAAQGRSGPLEGEDYRGVAVMAHVDRIPGVDWLIVTKQDRADLFASIDRAALWSAALALLLLLVSGTAMTGWRRSRQNELALARSDAAQQALRTSEARFRKLHEHATDISLLFDRDMAVRYATPSAADYLGRAAEGEPIASGTARVHPDDVAKAEAARRAALARPGTPQHFRHRLRHDVGGWRTMEATFTGFFDDPEVGGLSYQAHDITDRMAAEQALSESEERYRIFFHLTPDAVFVHRNNVIFMANEAAARFFRADSAEALVGRDWHELVAAEQWPRIDARVALLESDSAGFLPPAELSYLGLDGTTINAEATAARILVDGVPAILSVARDITERREAERQRLAHAREQRDALVREVHHRIKNHLQGLAGLLRQHLSGEAQLGPVLEEVIGQINAISVVHGLQGRAASGRISLRGLVAEIAAFLGGLRGLPIRLEDDARQCFRAQACSGNTVCRWYVPEEEAVPLALIVSELLTNAVRHQREAAPLSMSLVCDGAGARLAFRNPGRLPEGMDFAAGRGLGTGLGLVRSLMPARGLTIAIAQAADDIVETRLELGPPVLQPEVQSSNTA